VPHVKFAMDYHPRNSFSMCYASRNVIFPGVCHWTYLQISSGCKPINQRKHYKATNSWNNCSALGQSPEMSYTILRINKWLKHISYDVQLIPQSTLVRKYIWIKMICQPHTPMSILLHPNLYIVTLVHTKFSQHRGIPSN
jgi:hypothetical protein